MKLPGEIWAVSSLPHNLIGCFAIISFLLLKFFFFLLYCDCFLKGEAHNTAFSVRVRAPAAWARPPPALIGRLIPPLNTFFSLRWLNIQISDAAFRNKIKFSRRTYKILSLFATFSVKKTLSAIKGCIPSRSLASCGVYQDAQSHHKRGIFGLLTVSALFWIFHELQRAIRGSLAVKCSQLTC